MKPIKITRLISRGFLVTGALSSFLTLGCHENAAQKPLPKHTNNESSGQNSLPISKENKKSSDLSDPTSKLRKLIEDDTIESDVGKREEAIVIIRSLAAQKRMDAIPLFLDGLIVIRPFSVPPGSGQFALFPCAEALIEIGAPAIPQIENKFFSLLVTREQFLAFEVLLEIRGSVETAKWLDQLPEKGPRSLPLSRREELKIYAISLDKPGRL
jgi:hypothetical protein